ncbi:MAG: hypothetical protein ISR44_03720 [Rhodospirillales bacterium]|nr:hypothetical protein [Rhodospirillales bacterium]
MTTPKLSKLRKMTVEEVISSMTGFSERSGPHIAGMIELKRRQEWPNEVRGWIAIVISVVSIGIAIAAFLDKT